MRIWRKYCESRKKTNQGTFLGRLRSDSRGTTLAMAGAALVPIAAMIGSGLDMSRAYMAQAKLQNACDAGALAARREMAGTNFSTDARDEGYRFFEFNYPDETMSSENVSFVLTQDTDDQNQINGVASADVPTTVMSLFGNEFIPISVSCDAKQDYGNNDIMVVLDVTGSMNCAPGGSGSCGGTEQSGSKASRLRAGATALYNALGGAENTRTRYGLMPYSVTVNVGADLRTTDIRREHYYVNRYCGGGGCYYGYYRRDWGDTQWAAATDELAIQDWQTSGEACVDERGDVGHGTWYDDGNLSAVVMDDEVSREDIDSVASSSGDYRMQWGRYDTEDSNRSPQCPATASRLREYATVGQFNTAISAATANLAGNTYHDIGMVWAVRYLSSTGMFASDNVEVFNDVPVSKHIVYFTDGALQTTGSGYTAYGVRSHENRMEGSGGINDRHIARFQSACARARQLGATIWVVALGVADTTDIEPCATSSGHFFTSDGSDLEEVFERIGQGIGQLRLTQ